MKNDVYAWMLGARSVPTSLVSRPIYVTDQLRAAVKSCLPCAVDAPRKTFLKKMLFTTSNKQNMTFSKHPEFPENIVESSS